MQIALKKSTNIITYVPSGKNMHMYAWNVTNTEIEVFMQDVCILKQQDRFQNFQRHHIFINVIIYS